MNPEQTLTMKSDPVRSMLVTKPFYAAAIFVATAFSIILVFFPLSLVADDFLHFSKVYSPAGFQIWDLSGFISRVPLAVVFTKFYFYLPWAEKLVVPSILTFFIYAFSMARLFSFFDSQIGLNIDPRTAFFGLSVFLLYPTHYEILYWLTAMPYIFGLAFWVLSLDARHWIAIPLLAASFLNSEMYVLPALALPYLLILAKGDFRPRRDWTHAVNWGLAISLCVLVRVIIKIAFDLTNFHYVVGFSAPFLMGRIRDTFFQVFSIHFFKVLWVNTAVYWAALLILIGSIFRSRLITLKKFGSLVAVAFSSTAIYWVFDRNAPRALFGAQLIICLLIFYLVTLLEFKIAKKFLIVFAIVFVSATGKIFHDKRKNYLWILSMENKWSQKLKECADPCDLDVAGLGDGLNGDWVLVYEGWPNFMNFLISKYKITKTIRLNYIEPRPN